MQLSAWLRYVVVNVLTVAVDIVVFVDIVELVDIAEFVVVIDIVVDVDIVELNLPSPATAAEFEGERF